MEGVGEGEVVGGWGVACEIVACSEICSTNLCEMITAFFMLPLCQQVRTSCVKISVEQSC